MCKPTHSGGKKVHLLITENDRLQQSLGVSKKQYWQFGNFCVCSKDHYSMLNIQVRKCTHGTTFLNYSETHQTG